MQEIVRAWAVPVVVAILAGTLLETLLPETGIKKYVKFAIALAVMLVILMPIASLFNGGIETDDVLKRMARDVSRQTAEEFDLRAYKDYVYEVYMRNKQNMNE